MKDVKSLYVTVLSQQFSPCGKYLAAGTKFGKINLFNLQKIVNQPGETVVDPKSPYASFTLANGAQVYSLLTNENFLIVGSANCVFGYDWDKLKECNAKGTPLSAQWTINFPSNKETLKVASVDCMEIYDSNKLVLGCRDNSIRLVDLDHGQVLSEFTGHDNYIHTVSVSGNRLASGSEDGIVSLWDLRQQKQVHKINPSLQDQLSRPKLGKWIGAVALSEDWLVCGGGPRLSLWHLRSLTPSRVLLENSKATVHVAQFYEDTIIAAGQEPVVHRILFSGDTVVDLPSSSPRVYSVATSNNDQKLLTIAGSSNNIDVCRQSMYRDHVLHCVP